MRKIVVLAIFLSIIHLCYHYNVFNTIESYTTNSINTVAASPQTQQGIGAVSQLANFVHDQVTQSCNNLDVKSTVLNLFNQNRDVERQNLTGISLNSVTETSSTPLYKMCSAHVFASDNSNYQISYKVVPIQGFQSEIYLYLN
jgi:hypothetical protein